MSRGGLAQVALREDKDFEVDERELTIFREVVTREHLEEMELTSLINSDPLLKDIKNTLGKVSDSVNDMVIFNGYCMTALETQRVRTNMFHQVRSLEEHTKKVIQDSGLHEIAAPILLARRMEVLGPTYARSMEDLPRNAIAGTTSHVIGTTFISDFIAEELGITDRQTRSDIGIGSMLHDVSKYLTVFRKLAEKKGPLTAEEDNIMKNHPVVSAELLALSGRNFSYPIIEMVIGHHKGTDNKGYAYGLDLPNPLIGTRILQVADQWEARTGDRPYRTENEDPSHVLADLFCKAKEGSFDPDCVGALFNLTGSNELYRLMENGYDPRYDDSAKTDAAPVGPKIRVVVPASFRGESTSKYIN